MSDPASSSDAVDTRHMRWLRSTVALALFFGLCHCPNLWTSNRTYAFTPVSDALPPLPPLLNQIWFDALLAATVALALWPRAWLVWCVLLLSGTLTLWDQSRWQPWFFQYWWMLVALAGGVAGHRGQEPGPPDAAADPAPTPHRLGLNLCLLILALTYFWSGVQKCNPAFFDVVYPWFIKPILPKLPAALQNMLEGAAWTVPLLEIALGIGMLCRRLQWLALLSAMAMHLFILWCLGPWGHHWNTVVWPWNIAMIAACLILVGHTGKASARELLVPQRSVRHWLILLLFGLLPPLSLFGYWDKYLSAALYSGNTLSAWIQLDDAATRKLPPAILKYQFGSEIDTFQWAISELNVPPYPEPRIYRALARHLRHLVGPGGKVELIILLGTDPQTGEKVFLREEIPP